jgi:hypothetical protein
LIGTIRLEIFIDYRSVKRRPNNPVTITGIRKHARQPEGLAGAGSWSVFGAEGVLTGFWVAAECGVVALRYKVRGSVWFIMRE